MMNPRRERFLVSPKFQFKYVGYTIGMSIVAMLSIYGGARYVFWKMAQIGNDAGFQASESYYLFLERQKHFFDRIAGGTSLGMVGLLLLFGLFRSNRIAGPLYRLRKHMIDVASGKTLGDVGYRERDEFIEVYDSYNDQMRAIRERLGVESPAPGSTSTPKKIA